MDADKAGKKSPPEQDRGQEDRHDRSDGDGPNRPPTAGPVYPSSRTSWILWAVLIGGIVAALLFTYPSERKEVRSWADFKQIVQQDGVVEQSIAVRNDQIHAGNVRLADDIDLDKLARSTPMFSGADLAAMVNEAAIMAGLDGSDRVTMEHLQQARDKVRFGRAMKSRKIEEEQRVRSAYHEATASCAKRSKTFQPDPSPSGNRAPRSCHFDLVDQLTSADHAQRHDLRHLFVVVARDPPLQLDDTFRRGYLQSVRPEAAAYRKLLSDFSSYRVFFSGSRRIRGTIGSRLFVHGPIPMPTGESLWKVDECDGQ